MNYQEYIDLGFTRSEMNDNVEFKETGYHGFSLEKKINETMAVSVCSGELDKPKLYIKKAEGDTYFIIPITGEVVKGIFSKPI